MSEKPKVAWYWCASCGGCEESFVDLAERLLKVFEAVDIVFCPVAMDFKREDVEKLPDGSITVALINGGIRLKEHEEMVKLLRKKSKIVIAYGACSAWGGIPGLANLYNLDEALERKYLEVPTIENPKEVLPTKKIIVNIPEAKMKAELELPEPLPVLLPLDKVIDVDYYIPGCPPTPDVFWNALQALLSGNLPPKGAIVGASNRSLCDECSLNETKPEKVLVKEFKRPDKAKPEPNKCLLAQGFLCMGPVTRGGCTALCIKGNMPCTGCFGLLDGIVDYGGKAISYFGSILDYSPVEDKEIKKAFDSIPDWVGTIYKYSLASAKLSHKAGAKKPKRIKEVVEI
ncbi:MAG: oxidoreductase [Archaeoglobales archaeon]|nr:oxidoreductase [Archaeoglobales archaeon]